MFSIRNISIFTVFIFCSLSLNAQEAEPCIKVEEQKPSAKRRRSKPKEPLCEEALQNTNSVVSTKIKERIKRINPGKERKKNPVSPIPVVRLDDYAQSVPVPDRWRIVDSFRDDKWYDPYNRNTLKADKPVFAEDWFFSLGVISDTVYESRQIPTPVGASSTNQAGSIDVFGSPDQTIINQLLATEFVLYKGDTVFRPPDYEIRFTPVFNYNYLSIDELQGVNVNPENGTTRHDQHVGIQAAFLDVHLRNDSDRYDFDSVRVGVQPFSSDFRGFLFQDSQLGVRFFGNRRNNIFQYNLALFQRIEKDTNSGLNDVGQELREDYVFFTNLYWQDLFYKGFTSQFSFTYNKNTEDRDFYFDNNGFIARPASLGREVPRGYDAFYLGYSGDGHIGRINLSTSYYYAFGEVEPGVFVDEKVDIDAHFFAAEFSFDSDWVRPKLSFLYGSGDSNPFDDKAQGFDSIFENPQFAGADSSYWIRQNVPLIGGGRVALSSRNGILNSMRSSKEQGQSNFTNPGIGLIGVGFDMDLLPELRLSGNANNIHFIDTTVLEVARNQANIDTEIGWDLSLSLIYRPLMTQNVVLRASYSNLIPGKGYDDLFPEEDSSYLLFNLILTY